MRARAVIGANFGDEGKGLMVDYLCSQGAGMVVRFNGGAQAGHTVVTPDNERHVFHHFGAGTFCGVPTYLSSFFICNPILFAKELDDLLALNLRPQAYAHPSCLVTTFADMIINQRIEDKRGAGRHGSVGVGVNETFERCQVPGLSITMADLWNGVNLEARLQEICNKWARFRTGAPIDNADKMIAAFMKGCERFAELVPPLGIDQCRDPVFEGAQGLLLSQDNKEYFPHLTRSYTGSRNVRILCEQLGIKDLTLYYVSRTYLTRHGAGPLPGEDPKMKFADDTNTDHEYQGSLRFAPLGTSVLSRCTTDAKGAKWKIVLTHCDQVAPQFSADLHFFGPKRTDVRPYMPVLA